MRADQSGNQIGNNLAKEHSTEGAELFDFVLEAEKCDGVLVSATMSADQLTEKQDDGSADDMPEEGNEEFEDENLETLLNYLSETFNELEKEIKTLHDFSIGCLLVALWPVLLVPGYFIFYCCVP
jgi:DNA-directed RNA polymerase specialized sigma subunit